MENDKIKEKYLKILLETFKSLVTYLEDNNYNWFVAYGTLLGTIRHKGMIPWDDDIDIIMPRKDFERFVSEREKLAVTSPYRVIAPGDENYYLSFGKYYDSRTTLWEHKYYRSVFGVYVDVFCFDYYCGEKKGLHEKVLQHQKKWGNYVNSIKDYSFDYFMYLIKGMKLRTLVKLPLLYINHLQNNKKKAWEEYSTFMKNFWRENVGQPRCCAWLQQDKVYDYKWFEDYEYMPFEDIKVRVPLGYHEYLTKRYGDYMILPPKSQQVSNATHTQYYLNLGESLNIKEIEERIQKGEHFKL